MKTTFFALALVLFSACSSSDDGDQLACQKATADFDAAMKAYVAGVNAHPPFNAAPYVMDKYEADMKKLWDAREAASKAKSTACQ